MLPIVLQEIKLRTISAPFVIEFQFPVTIDIPNQISTDHCRRLYTLILNEASQSIRISKKRKHTGFSATILTRGFPDSYMRIPEPSAYQWYELWKMGGFCRSFSRFSKSSRKKKRHFKGYYGIFIRSFQGMWNIARESVYLLYQTSLDILCHLDAFR